MKSVRIDKTQSGSQARYGDFDEAELMDGDVTLAVLWSSLNYKDGLAMTGKAPVVRRFPMIPGIDLVGRVTASDNPRFRPGMVVLATGCGLGETHLGGYAPIARLNADWLTPLPIGLSGRRAMAIGTAGFTAMLALTAIESHGLQPADGPLLVTGAAGGVGSIAVALAARAGWRVIASTGRPEEADYLRALGAAEIIERAELSSPGKPLGKERWAAAIDVAGSHTLANVLSQTRYGGAAAACGLAQGIDFPGSVAPFILRGVALLGVDSVYCPQPRRAHAWARLARDLDLDALDSITQTVPLARVIDRGEDIIAGRVRGRVVVDVAGEP